MHVPPLDAGELEEDLLVQLYPPLQDPQKYLWKVKMYNVTNRKNS